MEKNFSVASASECKIIDTKMKEFINDLKIVTVVTILAYCIIFDVPILILGFYPCNDVFIKASGLPTRKMPFSYYEDEVIDYIMKNDRTFDLRDFDYDSIDFNEIYSRKNKLFHIHPVLSFY